MSYSRLTVILNESEMERLRHAARQNVRRPRDHVRYILLKSLGLDQNSDPLPTNANGVVNIRQDSHDTVAA